jgi:hypothetical protein
LRCGFAHPQWTLPRAQLRRMAAAATGLVVLITATPASAQETREGQLAAARADKATRLHEYQPTPLEGRILSAERLLGAERAVYPFIGSAFDGGGLAIGPGYRARFADSGTINAHAAWSIRNYKAVSAQVRLPEFANRRLLIEANGNWLDAPAVTFYGVGNATSNIRRDYAYRSTTIGASARLQAAKFVAVGAGMDFLAIDATDASPTYQRSQRVRPVRLADVPFVHQARRTLPRRLVRLSGHQVRRCLQLPPRRRGSESVRADLRENWVIALRAAASTTDAAAGNDVPYYLMPDLGGSHSLRGYPTWRFRDRNRLLFSGEYRWTAGPFVDMALFADAGKVAARFQDLDLRDLKKTYGIGMTLHTPNRTLTRIELARTREGMGLSFSFSPSF